MICDDTNSQSQSSMSVDVSSRSSFEVSPVKSFLQQSWYEEVERFEAKQRTKHYMEEEEVSFRTYVQLFMFNLSIFHLLAENLILH